MAKGTQDFVKSNKHAILYTESRTNDNIGTCYSINRHDVGSLNQNEFKKILTRIYHAIRGRNIDRGYFYVENYKVFEIAINFDISFIDFENSKLNNIYFVLHQYENAKLIDEKVTDDENEITEIICKTIMYQPFLDTDNSIDDD